MFYVEFLSFFVYNLSTDSTYCKTKLLRNEDN